MKERIQKILANHGVTSRRKAEEMILDGRITCNGRVCTLGDSADIENDLILLDGMPIPSKSEKVYIMLNKPRGYVTTLSDEKGRKNVVQLVADCNCRVYPVGRLDMDSEGLLILTNDGSFANMLMHPRHKVDKTYRVTVKNFSEDAFNRLSIPIVLDGRSISPPQVTKLISNNDKEKSAVLLITIHEGRNRQIRRMCAIAGLDVVRLVRISEGSLELGALPVGKWRYLSKIEIEALIK